MKNLYTIETLNAEAIKELENFIDEGIRAIDHRDNLETIGYINCNIENKELFKENDLNGFIAKLRMKETQLSNTNNSDRAKGKKEAITDLLDKYSELNHKEMGGRIK